jgi:(E)-4-hydroxy-3-methylbut-2-enyl-diphosphate synthase
MIKRRKTSSVTLRSVDSKTIQIGGGSNIVIQSMTKVPTTDVEACIAQINSLLQAGCDLIRIAVPTRADTAAFAQIASKVSVPLVADIHFSPDRAIEAIEGGAAKIRLNPGNIKAENDILRIIDAAKANGTAIRIGVNEASIRDLKSDVAPADRIDLMISEMTGYVRFFEKASFSDIVLSAKSADTLRTIDVNRAIAKTFDYPIHVGLTHAGLIEDARVSSSVAIGTLLSEGIGDTIRVSIAGDPTEEIKLAKEILTSLGLIKRTGPELIVCPTCGRCQIDVVELARKVRQILEPINKPLRIAVMGCIVNGPGEAADADVAVCAAKGKGYIYAHGKQKTVVPEQNLLQALKDQIEQL